MSFVYINPSFSLSRPIFQLFSKLKQSNPMALEKMVPIAGDVTLLKLGLSDNDWQLMQKVSVIFHAAASVR